jgi:hypothetical protein
MKRALEALGIQVELSPQIKGASGVSHQFDLLLTKGGKRVPLDLRMATEEHVEFGEVLETYAKILDTKSKPSVIVAMPGTSTDARKAAEAFGLILVEGVEPHKVVERLNVALSRFF